MKFYQGKRVFITGGSSGIGKSAAILCAKWGADVAIAARRQGPIDETLAELTAVNPDGTFAGFSLDVADKEAVMACAPEVVEALGGIDVVINNAGVAEPGYVQDLDSDVFDSMMDINYFGTVYVTRAFLPFLVDQNSGYICNVSSVLGFMGVFGYTAYAASKFAVTGFSECLRQEVVTKNVEVCVVYPPDTDTPQWHAENEVKPPETKMLSGNIKVMPPEVVAMDMLAGIAAGKKHVYPGFGNKFVQFMNQHFPGLVRWFIDSDLKKYQRKNA